ncbi:MAG: class I SAM-dependent methyltransferase, partial [Terrabacter sp.]
SLVLHYLEDWTAPLAELRRILKPGGRLLLSVNHPRILESSDPEADYFSVTRYSEEYTFGDQEAVLTYWHRPLHAMSDAFNEAGFRIARISEPPFSPDTPRELLPPGLGDRTAFICFISSCSKRATDARASPEGPRVCVRPGRSTPSRPRGLPGRGA